MKKKIGKYTLVPAVLAFMVSCRLFSVSDSIGFSLPPLPEMIENSSSFEGWDVLWLGMDGSLKTRHLEPGEKLILSIPREKTIPVTAAPRFSRIPFSPRPAGAVLSDFSPRASSWALRWEEGFAADFLLDIAGKGFPLEGINADRFVKASLSRSPGSPWLLDKESLRSGLAQAKLWIYSFRGKEVQELSLSLPQGEWLSEDPLTAPVVFPRSEPWALPPGLSRFLGPGEVVAEVWAVPGEEYFILLK